MLEVINFIGTPHTLYYDDSDPAINPDGDEPTLKNDTKQTFTQDDVNKIVAEEKRNFQKRVQTLNSEIDSLKQKGDLTAQQKKELESKIDELNSTLMTKEELAAQEKKKIEKQAKQQQEILETEAKSWRDRYTKSTIENNITSAAIENDAISPDQIIALIGPNTRLVEEQDANGEATGNFITKVKFNDIDENGKSITLDLSVQDAVKRMTELSKFQNLFKNTGNNGLGLSNNNNREGELNLSKIAKDPVAYRKALADGLIKNR